MKKLIIFCMMIGFDSSMSMEQPKKIVPKRSYESETEAESESENESRIKSPKRLEKQAPLIQLLVNASDSDALVKSASGVFIIGKSLDYKHEISLTEPVIMSVLSHIYKIEFERDKILISKFKKNPNIFEKIAEIPAQGQSFLR